MDNLFPEASDLGEPLVQIAMTRDDAWAFMAALAYGAEVAKYNAENAGLEPATAETVRQHEEQLRRGHWRLRAFFPEPGLTKADADAVADALSRERGS